MEYDDLSHIIKVEQKGKEKKGLIAVCTAGTADISVAEEAAQTAEYFGSRVERIYDVGGQRDPQASVQTGRDPGGKLRDCGGPAWRGLWPASWEDWWTSRLIAVPTSVGYGASMNGLSALLTMINSCANGIAVVNIDNGYGAGYIATQINRLGIRDREE